MKRKCVFSVAIEPETKTDLRQAVAEIAPAEKPTGVPYQSASMDWDAEESYLLAKIAMAEAESEDTEGKALVMLVVLNRVRDDEEFPDTIEEVIYQPGQFSPISNGRFDEVEPNADCWAALDLIMLDKWDESCGATYFESESESIWHSKNLDFLFQHGKHYFYKGREKVIKGKAARNLMAVAYTLAVTFAVGKWAICAAYLERGYKAVGGEYCLMPMVCWVAWEAINYLFDTLEDLEYERNCKKRRSRGNSWMHDNR